MNGAREESRARVDICKAETSLTAVARAIDAKRTVDAVRAIRGIRSRPAIRDELASRAALVFSAA